MSGVEGVIGLLGIVGTVDVCCQWGKKLVELCNSYRHANEEIRARSIRLEAGWLKTERQLEFMKQIDDEMDEYHRSVIVQITEQLYSHLRIAWDKLYNVSQMQERENDMFRHFRRTTLRWKYALFKQSIDMAIEELDRWHATADPGWYLLLRISNPRVDQALNHHENNAAANFPNALRIRNNRTQSGANPASQSVFLPQRDLDSMVIYELPLCNAKMAQRMSSSRGTQNLILTTLECPPGAKVDLVAKEVRELANKLAVDDHKTFGLLSCKGVVRKVVNSQYGAPTTSFTMVFRSPDNQSDMSSLRSKLLSRDSSVTLSDRFIFAQQLAKSVAYIHTFGFVHKSVRPENILIFAAPTATTYLAGFDSFRKDDGRTYRQGLYEWEKNLYIHPSRQGLTPREDYVMQHDIYSLGVCLLEIGLWESFVLFDKENNNPVTSSLLNAFALDCQEGRCSLAASKDYLVKLCRNELPRRMGRKYYEVVETCLTCLDPDNVDFGDERELMDDDGIVVGVRYIEKVLSRLNEISL